MNENKEVMACLKQLSEQMSEQFSGIQGQLNHLDAKIDKVEESLGERIDMVYCIACENRENIQEMRREINELLIPYNDRNLSVNEQISKISELEEWKDEAEKVIGNHSQAIRKLQEAIA